MKWDTLANKGSTSAEPHSDRELLMVIVSEIKHINDVISQLHENQAEIRNAMAAPTPQYNELCIKLDNLSDSLDELKEKVGKIEEIQDELCKQQARSDTYFKILGAVAVLFPTLLISIVQIIFS